jgi:hypothetical protein
MAKKPDDSASKKHKTDALQNWLTTDDWLGVGTESVPIPGAPQATPAPSEAAIGGEMFASDGPGSVLPLGAEKSDSAEMRPSQTPSSARIAREDLAAMAQRPGDPESDEGIDLATPPDASLAGPPSLSKIMKASGAKSDILRGGPLGKGAESSDIHAGHTPTAPASGWLSNSASVRTPMPPLSSGSRADIGNGGLSGSTEEISDIFNGARHSDAGRDGTGSNLLPGMSGVGRSSVFNDPSRSGIAGGESDLFGGLTGASGDRNFLTGEDSAPTPPNGASIKDAMDIFRRPPSPVDEEGDASGDVPLIEDDLFETTTVLENRPFVRTPGPESSAS